MIHQGNFQYGSWNFIWGAVQKKYSGTKKRRALMKKKNEIADSVFAKTEKLKTEELPYAGA
jgi:hypothetical protein